MDGKDPCWYQAYENFDRFLRSTLSNAINEVLYNSDNMTVVLYHKDGKTHSIDIE